MLNISDAGIQPKSWIIMIFTVDKFEYKSVSQPL